MKRRTRRQAGWRAVQQQGHQQARWRPDGSRTDRQGHVEDIKTAMSFQTDLRGRELPKNATDTEMARQLCNVAVCTWYGHKPGLIAKIRRAEAIPRLERRFPQRSPTASRFARGDLAVEVGNAAVPACCKEDDPHGARHGQGGDHRDQMMESMITNPVPTRAGSERRGQCRAGRHRYP